MPSGSAAGRHVAEGGGGGVADVALRFQQVDVHRLDAAAQLHAVEAAEARALFLVEPGEDVGGDQRLVVAGVVEQPGRDVDRVAEHVARHLDHLAAGQRDLQLQRLPAPACRGAPMRSIDSCISSAAAHGRPGSAKIAIRPSPSVLTTWPPVPRRCAQPGRRSA